MLAFYWLIFTIDLCILDTCFCGMHVLQYFSQFVFAPLVFLHASSKHKNLLSVLKTNCSSFFLLL